jgi:hypothetical protein
MWYYNSKLSPLHAADHAPLIYIDGNLEPGDPNPLRLVCHQTRAETKGLLQKSNAIIFRRGSPLPHRTRKVNGNIMFVLSQDCWWQCSPVNRARLKKTIFYANNASYMCDFEILDVLHDYETYFACEYKNLTFILGFSLADVNGNLWNYSAYTCALGIAVPDKRLLLWPNDAAYRRVLGWWCEDYDITVGD